MKDDRFKEFKLSKEVKKKLNDKNYLKKQLESGKSPQEIMGFTDEAMAKFYAAAYKLFESRRYQEAADAFLFLVTLNSYNHDYWLGLGMCAQMTSDYESAVDAYELAAILEPESPVPYFYLAKCLFALHDKENALQALALAVEYADDIDVYQDLKKQALAARALLLKDRG